MAGGLIEFSDLPGSAMCSLNVGKLTIAPPKRHVEFCKGVIFPAFALVDECVGRWICSG